MYYRNDEDDDSDYDQQEPTQYSREPNNIILAIDNHPMMFSKNENDDIPFRSCLEACYNLTDSLILQSGQKSWNSFILMLSGDTTPLININMNIIDSMKLLKELLSLSDDHLKDKFVRKDDLDLSNFFLTCKKLFHDIKSACYKRKIIYISNDDEPTTDSNSKFTALNEVKTFPAGKIDFQVVPMNPNFKFENFYNELYSLIDSKVNEEICTDVEGLSEKLISTIKIKANEHKVLFYPFKEDNERFMKCIRIGLFSSKKLLNTWMSKDGEKVVNQIIMEDNLEPEYVLRGDEENEIKFDIQEKESCLDISLPQGLTLLYISDRQLKLGQMVSKPYLIKSDPNEELDFFKKFWSHCVKLNKVLVCLSKKKMVENPKYVELIPCLINGEEMFLEKRIYYGHEIMWPESNIEYPKETNDDDDGKRLIKKLVDVLTFDFDYSIIPDNAYERKKAYIKAKLLGENKMEEVSTPCINNEELDKQIEDIVEEINNSFDIVYDVPRKRAAPSTSRGRGKCPKL